MLLIEFEVRNVFNQHHVDILLSGVEAWNEWRLANPKIVPNLLAVDLSEKNLQGANLSQTNLMRAKLERANLRFANLQKATLKGADLFCADLQSTSCNDAIFRNANLQGANLQCADFASAEFQDAQLEDANLRGANLQGAYLQAANLQFAQLQGANLRGAGLYHATLFRADLQGADLQDANLHRATFFRANLRGANMKGAKLWGAFLRGAYLLDGETNIIDFETERFPKTFDTHSPRVRTLQIVTPLPVDTQEPQAYLFSQYLHLSNLGQTASQALEYLAGIKVPAAEIVRLNLGDNAIQVLLPEQAPQELEHWIGEALDSGFASLYFGSVKSLQKKQAQKLTHPALEIAFEYKGIKFKVATLPTMSGLIVLGLFSGAVTGIHDGMHDNFQHATKSIYEWILKMPSNFSAPDTSQIDTNKLKSSPYKAPTRDDGQIDI